jgi:hypothetical protein
MEDVIRNEKTSSVSVSRTSKGAYSWDIKLYYDADSVNGLDIIERLKVLDDAMKVQFKGVGE